MEDSFCVINTRYISDILVHGTGSQFELVHESNHRYSGIRVISTATVENLILAMNNPFNPTTYTTSVYRQNNATKSTYTCTLSTEDIVIMFSDPADSSNTYIWYVNGDTINKILVRDESFDIYNSFVTFAGRPTNLVATVDSPTQVTLTWTVNAVGQTGVAISASEDGGLTYDETFYYYGAAIATCTQIGLTPGATYYYKARSFRTSAFSDYSNTVSVVPA